MRKFAVEFQMPTQCQCCHQALRAQAGEPTFGNYSFEIPEGQTPTELSIAGALKICLGGGKLEVEIKSPRGSGKQWVMQSPYNTDCFGYPKSSYRKESEEFGYYSFSFALPQFNPSIATWFARVEFVEVEAGLPAHATTHRQRCHNGRLLSIQLLNLS